MSKTAANYIVEVRDESGWMDYSHHAVRAEAVEHARTLRGSFSQIRLVDVREQVEIAF